MILVGFLFGIFLEVFREEGKLLLCMVVFACGMIFPFYSFRRGRGRFFVLVLWLIIGMVFGGTRYFVSEMVFDDDVRYLNGGGAVRFEACISEEPDVRSDKSKYIVSDVRVGDLSFDGDVLVSASKYPIYEYGDVVEVFGGFEEPGVIDGFEYDKYLAVKGIYSIVNSSSIRFLEREGLSSPALAGLGCGNFFTKWIYKFKFGLNDRIFKLFPEPHAGFISGLLLGMRSGISKDLSDDFKETGLTHIIAISGYNITLVIIAVSALFSFLKRKLKVIFAGIFIVLFVILVGGGSSVVRAAIMGILGLFAVYSGRSRDIFAVLVFSAFAMNLWNPKLIVFDTGFQLSFLATMGLVYVSPKLKNFSLRIPAAFAIRENFTMTLSAQAFALPVILKAFGRISLICPIANILILPFIPFVMIFGFLAAVLNSSVVAFFCYIILDVVFFLVRIFADLSRTL
jgi:competence protein ComEC